MAERVLVVGGGVAGLSAAHELSERGFEVHVYEKRGGFGGKARSIPVPGSGRDGRADLPGEHGFRFFPRFYRHLPDTMKRIPFPGNALGTFDNLVDTERVDLVQRDAPPLQILDRAPRHLGDLTACVHALAGLHHDVHLQPGELEYFVGRLWQILTSCEARRLAEYEKEGWWDYIGATSRSTAYQQFLAVGLTRSIVAARAQQSNAKATGDILVQLVLGMGEPGVSTDRVLCGPTNDVWIDPWIAHLERSGVALHSGHELHTIELSDDRVGAITFTTDRGEIMRHEADHVVLAVPVEVVAAALARPANRPLLDRDPSLAGLTTLAADVAWMNGLQLYLRRDVPIARGHCLLLDSPWAVTAISQAQFWPAFPPSVRGDGTVHGVLSVDISDWTVPGVVHAKPANECTRAEIAEEVWGELQAGLGDLLHDDDLHSWFLDPDIEEVAPSERHRWEDAEPLYLSLADTWRLRPEATTAIPNLYLASDYVRTNVQLPTMEGANEAARRAVNAILDASGSSAPRCQIWSLHEPGVLWVWRAYDARRLRRGKPWRADLPFVVHAAHRLQLLLRRLMPARGSRQRPARTPSAPASPTPPVGR